jgi:hypothetical protein
LQYLYLGSTGVTDDALKQIGKVYSLQILDLSHTSVSDEGLAQLSGLYALFELVALRTRITSAGQDDFLKSYTVARERAEKQGLIAHDQPRLKMIGR